jgi:putative ABC transport system permease protein
MFDRDKWQEIFDTIRKHKLRTFLTALGVFWGIFMLVFLMGAGKGLENGVMGSFGNRATNALYVWPQRTAKPYMGLQPGRRPRLTKDDIRAITANFGDKIEYLAPRIWVTSGEIVRNDNSGAFDVRGETPDLFKLEPLDVDRGRFINQLDIEQRRKVICIGTRVEEVLFEKDEEAIGDYLRINGAEYLIVGVFKSNAQGSNDDDDVQSIFMPLTTAQQVTNQPNRIGWFVCSMYSDVRVSEVEIPLLAMLRERHKVHPEDEQGIRSFNLEKEFEEVQGLFMGISLITWVVGIGSLIAGIIGVGNIMLIVVKERTKEIGIRKALGATPGSIVSLVLLESVFITTIAGYLGLLLSTGIILLMGQAVGEGGEFFANPEVDVRVGLGALIILILAGALTGLMPALQASRINPVRALKDE